MANEMSTYITIVSDKKEVADKLQEIFKTEEGKYETNALDIINNIKGTTYSYSNETTKEDWTNEVDFPSDDLWDELIGPKWLYVDYEHSDEPEYCNIVVRSAWHVPIPFLQTLHTILSEIDNDIIIRGTYEDESYDPSGAFVYGGTDYDDMEDLDEEYDWDEAEEDDFYTENWHDMLAELEQSLVDAYLEFKDEEAE